MFKLLLLFGVFCAASAGEICYKTEYNLWFYYYTDPFYCEHGCCGASKDQYCCSKKEDDDDKDKEGWTVASIVGVSIGGVVALTSVILIIVCVVKICQANNKKIVTVQQAPIGMNVWATNTAIPSRAPTVTRPPTYTTLGYQNIQPPPYHPQPGASFHPPPAAPFHPPPGPARYDFEADKHSYL